MNFLNHTPYPAKFLSGSTGQSEIIGIVVCKVTYRLRDNIIVPVTEDEAWPVFDKPYEFRGVSFAPEVDFRKNDIDILIFGDAVAPGKKSTRTLDVSARCGRIHHQLAVFGDRFWHAREGGLSPTDPEPFVTMPLTNDRAFGGSAIMAGAEVFHPINPEGRGFLCEKQQVEGTLLPNLEDPDSLIVHWRDMPRPACWYKPVGMLQSKKSLNTTSEKFPLEMMQSMFNLAVPELIAQPEDLGKMLHLSGLSEDGDVAFPVPDLEGPTVVSNV
ncbi:MAG: DUF2169 domain-containing protein, partial [Desulfobacterales bacterium]